MLEMRAAPGCFICIVGGCVADAGPILGLCWAHVEPMSLR